jgi:integrase
MGRQAAYSVLLDDGREVGFGLVQRGDASEYSVQFRDLPNDQYLFRSTRERSRPRALKAAEELIRDHFRPAPTRSGSISWGELREELKALLEADGARASTISDYIDTLNQVENIGVLPMAIDGPLAQRWCNEYATRKYTRKQKPGAKAYKRSPRTLHARVRKLKAMWSKYLVKRMKLVKVNPWEEVDLPKLDAVAIRTLSSDQVDCFFTWLDKRWGEWRLPRLFFETKAVTGCRLGDLCQLKTADLQSGKIIFKPESTKARRQRVAVLPSDLFAELKRLAGPVSVWESYATEIRNHLTARGLPTNRVKADFDPVRLSWWAKDEIATFNREHPELPNIRSHDFRKRAITEAHRAGLDVDTAAAAVGMSVTTARSYYLAMDQEASSELLTKKLADTLRPRRQTAEA